MKRAKKLAALLLAALVLAGCGSKKEKAAAPAASAAPSAAAASQNAASGQSAEHTPSPAPTSTPVPTATPHVTEEPTASPTPKPKAAPTPTPRVTSPPAWDPVVITPVPGPALPFITKHPTSETVTEGGSCAFLAGYINAIWAVWHFVSPDGKTDLTYEEIGRQFPTMKVEDGMYSLMKLSNIPLSADGWKVYCRYTNSDGYTNTNTATINVKKSAGPTPTPSGAGFAGVFVDSVAGRGAMNVDAFGALYTVSLSWSNSSDETLQWKFSGAFDDSGVMRYTDCTKIIVKAGAAAIQYTGGTGTLTYSSREDAMRWVDNVNHTADDTVFVRSAAPTSAPTDTPAPTAAPAGDDWRSTGDLSAAVAHSGVSFSPPVPEALPGGSSLVTYRSRPGVIEAQYTGGLVIRKSNTLSGSELSGDSSAYYLAWEITLKGLRVNCRGDGATINEATFSSGEFHYSICRNMGQVGYGLSEDQINSLVNGMY